MHPKSVIAIVLTIIAAFIAVSRATAQTPTPEPTPAFPITFEENCTPTSFQPDVWVAVLCVQHVTNHGTTDLTNLSTRIPSYRGPVPTYYIIWTKQNDDFVPVTTIERDYPAFNLAAGASLEQATLVLFQIPEGTFEFEAAIYVGDQLATSQWVSFDVRPAALVPSPDVTVDIRSLTQPPATTLTYETTVTNHGSAPISDLDLTLRLANVSLLNANPVADSAHPEEQIASWSLASFGKNSLAPGESLVLDTVVGVPQGQQCSLADLAAAVRVTVGNQLLLFGTRSADQFFAGGCPIPNKGGGGQSVPVQPVSTATPAPGGASPIAGPSTGEGATSRDETLSFIEAAAIGGVMLVLVGLTAKVARKRLSGR